MAQLLTETINITLSKLVKNHTEALGANLLPTDFRDNLEAVITELVGEGVLVEIE